MAYAMDANTGAAQDCEREQAEAAPSRAGKPDGSERCGSVSGILRSESLPAGRELEDSGVPWPVDASGVASCS